ncbi:hypothetical protein ACFT2C_21745 [Promicromonospora sp. NPDC057138]|uniref:hypothetical protein n=1 Tax=Promicromonospora sp. NPDC057138 TaxID=3346031 RepID=UPI0036408102
MAISAGLVVAATTGASAMVVTDGDLPASTSITAAADPVPDVAAEEVAGAVEAPVAGVEPPLPLPEPAPGLLDGLLSAITNLIGSLLGGLPVPLPVPGV